MSLIKLEPGSDDSSPNKSERNINCNENLQNSNDRTLSQHDSNRVCHTEMNFDKKTNKSNLTRNNTMVNPIEETQVP